MVTQKGNLLDEIEKDLEDENHERFFSSGKMGAPLFGWPWQNLGSYKYLLFGPLLVEFIYSRIYEKRQSEYSWCLHILILSSLRATMHQLWSSYNNMLFIHRIHRLSQKGIDFDQIDKEWHWDNFVILQAIVGSIILLVNPSIMKLPIWKTTGIIFCLIFHVSLSEPLYYWFHRLSHSSCFFQQYHWLHHSSKVNHPYTGVPIIGTTLIGHGSVIMFYGYILLFDFLRCMGHSNVEVVPHHIFNTLPVLKGKLLQSWIVPRFGFMYFLPFAKDGINNQIEEAILMANRIGVRVLSLAALNKNEALNGGGKLFVAKLPDLKVRIVHGNMLTAAVILNEIPQDVKEVFLTGATSKLGRAIALYLARRKVRILMLTHSTERFTSIQKEASMENRKYLIQVTKFQAAKHCKTWILGKWSTPREQKWASPGTHFHQFVVPPVLEFRRDCTYSKLAAMKLPDDVQGLGACEYTMERGVVHACHAGGIVHLLEGWTHHEVGAIDVDELDSVWEAALRHGFKPV